MTDDPIDVPTTSYSNLTLHRKCPQAWMYRYELGLERSSLDASPERDFGSWWSVMRAADALERGRRAGSLVLPQRTMRTVDGGPEFEQDGLKVIDVLNGAVAWWKTQPSHVKDTWMERLGQGAPARLRDAFVSWRDTWAETLKYEHPLGVEVKWIRELPRPEGDEVWDQREHPVLFLKGYIDEVYHDTRRDLIVVRDQKTSKSLDASTSLDDMMDSQLQLYCWGVQPLLTEHEVGRVKAVAYDRTRSVAPKEPQITLAGALSKSVTAYDLKTYLRWSQGPDGEGVPWGKPDEYYVSGAKKGQPKFGLYQTDPVEVARLSTPATQSMWHQRTLVPLNRNVVAAHLRAAIDTATDAAQTQKRIDRTREAPRNMTRSNCSWCDFASLCRAQMIGGPVGEYDLAQHGLVGPEGRTLLEITP